LGNGIRALFVDSIELSGSNWTTGLLGQFREKFGYDLSPYLPFVINEDAYTDNGYPTEWTRDAIFSDVLRRVRYDFNKMLVDMFLANFTQTFHDWCQAHGTRSRYQAYGMPWLMGMSRGYLIPDIPESNNWLFSTTAPYRHGYPSWNKYTSSSGHLAGRSIISCEAMTNTRGVFQTTLGMIKHADDINFIQGINHSILHGFNYSPLRAGLPGWVRYGAYFSEHNPWWPYFPLWIDYNARLSAVFQAARPVAQIAILAPEGDTWGRAGLARVPFQIEPWYAHRLWASLSNMGYTADYVCEEVVQAAGKENARLSYGPMHYELLILAGIESLMPATASAIADFARAGGKVVFIEKLPHRSPGFADAARNDAAVRRSLQLAAQVGGDDINIVPPPAGLEDLINWSLRTIEPLKCGRSVRIVPVRGNVLQSHHRWQDKELFFFVNADSDSGVAFQASFNTGQKRPRRWDPFTGRRWPVNYDNQKRQTNIELGAQESLLLVFESGLPARQAERPSEPPSAQPVELDRGWHGDFFPVQDTAFSKTHVQLTDLSQSPEAQLATFAGIILYRTKFDVDRLDLKKLDLGCVHGISEVRLNGKALGVTWYGRHVYDITGQLKPGNNHLEVKVTTVLLNHIKAMTANETAQIWTQAQQPVSTGLLGPVVLY
jgi:hypothetical protein